MKYRIIQKQTGYIAQVEQWDGLKGIWIDFSEGLVSTLEEARSCIFSRQSQVHQVVEEWEW